MATQDSFEPQKAEDNRLTAQWVSERVRARVHVCEWLSVWESVWMRACVSEWGGEREIEMVCEWINVILGSWKYYPEKVSERERERKLGTWKEDRTDQLYTVYRKKNETKIDRN